MGDRWDTAAHDDSPARESEPDDLNHYYGWHGDMFRVRGTAAVDMVKLFSAAPTEPERGRPAPVLVPLSLLQFLCPSHCSSSCARLTAPVLVPLSSCAPLTAPTHGHLNASTWNTCTHSLVVVAPPAPPSSPPKARHFWLLWNDPAPLRDHGIIYDLEPFPWTVPAVGKPGNLTVQVERTLGCAAAKEQNLYRNFAPRGELSFFAAFKKMCARATKYIYLEDQFVFFDEALQAVAEALPHIEAVIVVSDNATSMETQFAGIDVTVASNMRMYYQRRALDLLRAVNAVRFITKIYRHYSVSSRTGSRRVLGCLVPTVSPPSFQATCMMTWFSPINLHSLVPIFIAPPFTPNHHAVRARSMSSNSRAPGMSSRATSATRGSIPTQSCTRRVNKRDMKSDLLCPLTFNYSVELCKSDLLCPLTCNYTVELCTPCLIASICSCLILDPSLFVLCSLMNRWLSCSQIHSRRRVPPRR